MRMLNVVEIDGRKVQCCVLVAFDLLTSARLFLKEEDRIDPQRDEDEDSLYPTL